MAVAVPGRFLAVALLAGAMALACAAPRMAWAEIFDGPVRARVLRVIDGDSLLVEARIWLGQNIETTVRLLGVDAPELRARCDREKSLAVESKAFVETHIGGKDVMLRRIQFGKFANRVLAQVFTPEGDDLGAVLVYAGLARLYEGGERQGWCDEDPRERAARVD